jgi:Zn-dependent M28 family amino/carboxypeptidase
MEEELTNKQILLMDEVSRKLDFPLFFVDEDFTDALVFLKKRWSKRFVKNKKIRKPLHLGKIKGSINPNLKTIHTENIGGIIPAKNRKQGNKEHIVIMGHFDHLGIKNGNMYRGADDNASGISSILELARIFGIAKKDGVEFDRSIVFLAVSAEEIGLLGSLFYTKNAALPLSKTNAVLNIDMIGRENLDTLNRYSLFLIGADKINKQLSDINERVNETYSDLYLDYRYNEKDHPMHLYYRSDHYNFVKHDVPSVFYFGGFHEDYHKPSDTADKIDKEKLKEVSKFFFFTAWEIATNESLLKR